MPPRIQTLEARIAFVEDYDELLAQYLVHGVDVWVNNPLPPMEASGTSGMKATLNGVPQLSVLDGWWIEGYNGKNGWAIEGAEGTDRDALDAAAIYDLIGDRDCAPLLQCGRGWRLAWMGAGDERSNQGDWTELLRPPHGKGVH